MGKISDLWKRHADDALIAAVWASACLLVLLLASLPAVTDERQAVRVRIDDHVATMVPDTVPGDYVASRNGTKFYPRGCAAASRIHAANIISFLSETDAIAAGYSRTVQCGED